MKFEIEGQTLVNVHLNKDEKCVEVPHGVNKLKTHLFSNNENIEEVILPSTLREIRPMAFSSCINLKKINLPDKIHTIDNGAFCLCKSLEEIKLPNNLYEVKNIAFSACENLRKVIMKDNVKIIENMAFANCLKLEEINLSSTLEEIENNAFSTCINLKKIELPSSLKQIGIEAFSACSQLEEIIIPSTIKIIKRGTFSLCENLKKVILPSSLSYLGEYAFEHCSSLEKITLPSSLKQIGANSFYECSSLKELIIEEGIEDIGDYAFFKCSSLEEIVFPPSIKNINSCAFYGCSNLKKIVLPKNIENIGQSAFKECEKVEKLEILNLKCLPSPGLSSVLEYLNNIYFDEKENRIIASEKRIDDYKKIEYGDHKKVLKCGKGKAIIASLLFDLKDLKKMKYFNKLIPIICANDITIDNFKKIKNILKNYKEFDNLLNRLNTKKHINSDDINECYDLFKFAYTLGAFNENKVERQRACEFIFNTFEKEIFIIDYFYGGFEVVDLEKEIDKEWPSFVMNKDNIDELGELEIGQSGFMSRVCNSFNEIKEFGRSNKGKQHYRKVTINMAKEYLSKINFEGVNESNEDISQAVGLYTRDQESFNKAVEIRKVYEELKKSHIIDDHLLKEELKEIREEITKDTKDTLDNLNKIANNKFTFEFLSKADPLNYVLGKFCTCCAHIEGTGYSVMKASILHSSCQNLIIRDEKGRIIAKSTLYINKKQGYGVFNNIEVNNSIKDNKKLELIYLKYIEAVENFAKRYNELNKEIPLTQINVGIGLNDLNTIISERNKHADILEGLDFSTYGSYSGDWQKSQYVIWKNDSLKIVKKE